MRNMKGKKKERVKNERWNDGTMTKKTKIENIKKQGRNKERIKENHYSEYMLYLFTVSVFVRSH